jgi:hypothetical protein
MLKVSVDPGVLNFQFWEFNAFCEMPQAYVFREVEGA